MMSSRNTVLFIAGLTLVVLASLPAEAEKRHSKSPRFCRKSYKVVARDDLPGIAKSLGVQLDDLKRWNGIKGDRIPGKKKWLRYRPCVNTESIGRPNRGSLKAAISIDPDGDRQGNGWVLSPSCNGVWATPETIKYVESCAARYRSIFPKRKGRPIGIGDLSRRHGGSYKPHVSHESGRDVDIGYILKKPEKNGRFKRTRPRMMDMYKQWVLTKCFLDNPKTQYIFMERSLVSGLNKYIKRIYRKRRWKLRKYLQYFPGGSKHVIRGDKEHHSHMHVRFRCPRGDRRCID